MFGKYPSRSVTRLPGAGLPAAPPAVLFAGAFELPQAMSATDSAAAASAPSAGLRRATCAAGIPVLAEAKENNGGTLPGCQTREGPPRLGAGLRLSGQPVDIACAGGCVS